MIGDAVRLEIRDEKDDSDEYSEAITARMHENTDVLAEFEEKLRDRMNEMGFDLVVRELDQYHREIYEIRAPVKDE